MHIRCWLIIWPKAVANRFFLMTQDSCLEMCWHGFLDSHVELILLLTKYLGFLPSMFWNLCWRLEFSNLTRTREIDWRAKIVICGWLKCFSLVRTIEYITWINCTCPFKSGNCDIIDYNIPITRTHTHIYAYITHLRCSQVYISYVLPPLLGPL